MLICEKDTDLLNGASSGNTGHLATNFYYRRDRALLEAEMTAKARMINPEWLAGQPAVPRVKTGMIYIAKGREDEKQMEEMIHNSALNKVSGVRRLKLSELSRMEPLLDTSGVTAALYSEDEWIVDSWLLSMTHVYGALQAGVTIMTGCKVWQATKEINGNWSVVTDLGTFIAKCVINCAGNFGDDVQRLSQEIVNFRVTPGKGEYLVFEDLSLNGIVHGTVVPFPSKQTAGVYVFRSVWGHVVVGPTNIKTEDKHDRSISAESFNNLYDHVTSLYPDIRNCQLLGGYSGLRPATQHQDYVIDIDAGHGWVTVAGIRSTGLTCSLAISQYIAMALIPNYTPNIIPKMPAPVTNNDGTVKIGNKCYNPTHPLTKLGLLGKTLPEQFFKSKF